METFEMTGADLRKMMIGAYQAFVRECDYINNLNVFPVPDGDTGTNMMLTIAAVAKAVESSSKQSIGGVAKVASNAAIMGARGNSGVIMSQIIRGIGKGLIGKETATSREVGKAFEYGVLFAYRAVAQPMEGTILSVARSLAKSTFNASRQGLPLEELLRAAIENGKAELALTPEQLPALKAAGVVDAGGQGLLTFIQGCLEGLTGEIVASGLKIEPVKLADGVIEEIDLIYPYCTEFIITPCYVEKKAAVEILAPLGNSQVIVSDDNILKVHIHTANPGMVLDKALNWGGLHNIKIENMSDQSRNVTADQVESAVELAVIAVIQGDGIRAIYEELGANIIIDGGATMNPPVEDFVKAIHAFPAKTYVVLPNNKNILLAAEQLKRLFGDRVKIVPTRTIPEGIAVMMNCSRDNTLADNEAIMKNVLATIRSGALTIAARDSMVDGTLVTAGKYIGVVDGKVTAHSDTIPEALTTLCEKLCADAAEIISLYRGCDLSVEHFAEIVEQIGQKYPEVEVQQFYGGQPLYQLLVAVE